MLINFFAFLLNRAFFLYLTISIKYVLSYFENSFSQTFTLVYNYLIYLSTWKPGVQSLGLVRSPPPVHNYLSIYLETRSPVTRSGKVSTSITSLHLLYTTIYLTIYLETRSPVTRSGEVSISITSLHLLYTTIYLPGNQESSH